MGQELASRYPFYHFGGKWCFCDGFIVFELWNKRFKKIFAITQNLVKLFKEIKIDFQQKNVRIPLKMSFSQNHEKIL